MFLVNVQTPIADKRKMPNSTLDKIKKGIVVVISKLPSGDIKSQLIRLGITEGKRLKCIERLPGGTIVIQKGRQEIAIGSELAKRIKVTLHL